MIKVRGWRIATVEPFGLSCFFDPACEEIQIRALTHEEKAVRLDRIGSVSVVEDDAQDAGLDDQQLDLLKLPPSVKG